MQLKAKAGLAEAALASCTSVALMEPDGSGELVIELAKYELHAKVDSL